MTSVAPSPSKSRGRAGCAVDRTPSSAGLATTEFTELLNTARKSLPLSDACARNVNVVDVAPGMFVHVTPSVLTCHCGVGMGEPSAAAEKLVSTSGLITWDRGPSRITPASEWLNWTEPSPSAG